MSYNYVKMPINEVTARHVVKHNNHALLILDMHIFASCKVIFVMPGVKYKLQSVYYCISEKREFITKYDYCAVSILRLFTSLVLF